MAAKGSTMTGRILLAVLLIGAAPAAAAAQDAAERAYLVPALQPKHKDKPRVQGWADRRVEEKLNRGMVATPGGEGDDETPIIRSQGAHGMHAADVDGDGRDEVVLGSWQSPVTGYYLGVPPADAARATPAIPKVQE
jgi:hypothetical protein